MSGRSSGEDPRRGDAEAEARSTRRPTDVADVGRESFPGDLDALDRAARSANPAARPTSMGCGCEAGRRARCRRSHSTTDCVRGRRCGARLGSNRCRLYLSLLIPANEGTNCSDSIGSSRNESRNSTRKSNDKPSNGFSRNDC